MENDRLSVTVRFFGSLHFLMKDRALPVHRTISVPQEGCKGFELAEALGLPMEKIEAVFINGLIQSLDVKILPGDRVAFVPPGTPGPYRVLLGIYKKKR